MLKSLPENLIEKAVGELKSSDKPIFILGGGQTAGKVIQFLSDRGIVIDGILINRRFWDNRIGLKEGYPIYIMEDYLASNCCNLIVAFSGYRENLLEKFMNNIHKLYVLDFIGTLCLEGTFSMISSEFYKEHEKRLEWLENHLGDEKSRNALKAFLVQRMTGAYSKEEYDLNQYFPDDVICLHEDEIFLDCGAYCGETSIEFIMRLQDQQINRYKKIICVEADKENIINLQETLQAYDNIEVISAGVWDKTDVLNMNVGLGVGSRISDEGSVAVNVVAIDDILQGGPVTYIKMDIEGSELKALYGAEKTIKKYKPKLAICIYHKPEDLIEIPACIYSLRDDYRFYIRNHSPYGIETVLYAV